MSDREKTIYKVTLQGSAVNALLTVGKLIAGIMGSSAAMVADGVHSASDLLTDLVLIVFVKISSRPSDKDHSYGHGRFETLGSVLIGVALFAVAVKILLTAIDSIKEYLSAGYIQRPGMIALIAAAVSVILKELLYRYTVSVGRKINSQSMIANAWHHRSDAFSSIGTLLGISGASFLGEKWTILDPIAALIVVILIIKVSLDLTIPGLSELMDKSLPEQTQREIKEIVMNRPDVSDFHKLKSRRIGPQIALEFHLRVDGDMTIRDAHAITCSVENDLRRRFGPATQIIIHMEPVKEKV